MYRRFISRLPIKHSTAFTDIVVRECGLPEAMTWHAAIQPFVDPKRPDARWDWPSLYRTWHTREKLLGRNVSLFCVELPATDGSSVPCALMLLSEGYPSLDGNTSDSVFLWYVATAPDVALHKLGVSFGRPSHLLESLVDTAIQRSYELGYDGRVGLHAAPEGGDWLYTLYRDRVRMTALRSNAALTWGRRLHRGNDGRYFWSDPKLSQSLCNSLDYLR